jgi:hypothetical protein
MGPVAKSGTKTLAIKRTAISRACRAATLRCAPRHRIGAPTDQLTEDRIHRLLEPVSALRSNPGQIGPNALQPCCVCRFRRPGHVGPRWDRSSQASSGGAAMHGRYRWYRDGDTRTGISRRGPAVGVSSIAWVLTRCRPAAEATDRARRRRACPACWRSTSRAWSAWLSCASWATASSERWAAVARRTTSSPDQESELFNLENDLVDAGALRGHLRALRARIVGV